MIPSFSDLPVTTAQPIFKPVAFNFVDIEEKADEILAKAKAEAMQIMEAARNEVIKHRDEMLAVQQAALAMAEKTRQESEAIQKRLMEENTYLDNKRKEVETQAYKTGYDLGKKEGYDEGRKTGYADGELQATLDHDAKVKQEVQILLTGKLETLLPSLHSAIQQVQTAQQSFLLLWEQSAIHVAAAIAEKTIARQLPEMIDVPHNLLREALELAVGCSQMKIRLNPIDYETLQEEHLQQLIGEFSGAAATEIIKDVRITRGGCLLETSLGTIDQRIEERLKRIQMELV